jgi:hypothetical protein
VDDDLDFVQVAFREQRADRTVDQARGQGFFFRRTAFALEEAARDLAGSIGLLDVVDGQREEVLARLGVLAGTTVARTTVSSTDTRTAPLAWRAISPVSRVTVCSPYWKVFVTLLNMGNPFLFADRFSGAVVHLTTGSQFNLSLLATAGIRGQSPPLQQSANSFLTPTKLK